MSKFLKENEALITKVFLIGAGYFLLKPTLDGILVKLGLKDDKNTIKNELEISNQSAWSPDYWVELNKKKEVHLISSAYLATFVTTIYESLKHTFDDDDAIIGIFQQLHYKEQVSYLADAFYKKYKVSLYGYLLHGGGWSWASGMSTNNLAIVNNLVSKMK